MARFSDNYPDISPPNGVSGGGFQREGDDEWDFYLASVFGDVEALQQLRVDNPNVLGTVHYEFPLIMAVRNKRTDAVRFLLNADRGVIDGSPALGDNVWYSRCIKIASDRAFHEIHAMLVEAREEAEALAQSDEAQRIDETLKQPLLAGDVAEARKLLSSNPKLTGVPADDQREILLWAYDAEDTENKIRLIELLIDSGIDPNVAPIIHHASEANNIPLVRLLLEKGADPNTGIDSCSNCMWMARFANPDSYQELHELLASYGGRIPIHHEDDIPTADQLFNADHKLRDELYRTEELLWAVLRSDDVATLDRFVEIFGNEQIKTMSYQNGWCGPPSFAMLDRLVEHGLNVNQRDWRGRSFVFSAPDGEWLQRYIELGADLDAVEFMECSTRLGYAAFYNNIEMVKFLLENGADPNQPTEHEWARPLTQAKQQEHREMMELLRLSES